MARVKGNPDCQQCSLHKTAQSVCLMGQGPVPCEVLVLGEAPGYKEDDINKPFSGDAGQYLEQEISRVGLLRKEIYLKNTVR